MKVALAVWVRVPLVPVIVTVNAPVDEELQDNVAVAGDGGRVTGVMAPQVSCAGTVVAARATVPVKPLRPVTVMVEIRELPTDPEGEVAAMVKSTT